ncbi:MAG: isochorismate synthase [Opitutaceae bacterium]
MTILPLHPADHSSSPEALRDFLARCQAEVRRSGRPRLVSISLAVEALDPLAVLESIFDPRAPHFYAERPAAGWALAGAEVAVACTAEGPDRFARIQAWTEALLGEAVAVGDVGARFGGPHVFTAFGFQAEAEAGEPFPAAAAFVPQWQVGLAGDTTTAVANLLVAADSDLEALAGRVWRAHRKFRALEPVEFPPADAGPAIFERCESGDYPAAARAALELIARGTFRKLVLARALDLRADRPLHPLRMLNGLRQRFPDCYAFSFTWGEGPSFIGASPERLLRVRAGELATEALAGSIRRGRGAAEDVALAGALLRSEKDLREHAAVVEDVCGRLAALGVIVGPAAAPGVRRLANVQHLHTRLTGRLPAGVHPLAVAAALHPTPAVGGEPREGASELIRQWEGFPRGLYAGALGWVDARGEGEFFVGIRSALVEGTAARVYAGAGLVAGSDPEKELAETDLKFKAMVEAITS